MKLTDCFKDKIDLVNNKIKIVRHVDPRMNNKQLGDLTCYDLYKADLFEDYQSYQEENVFHECDIILSFVGQGEGFESLFVGAYRVDGYHQVNGLPDFVDAPYRGYAKTNTQYHYDLTKLEECEDLEGKLIVDFKSRQWHQWIKNEKEVKSY